MSASIIAENLVKTYGTNNEVRALDGLSLTVKEGTVLSLLGPNGSGKTTTVRVLSTLLRPDSGRATVAGIDVLKNPQQVREIIGLSGQYAAVDETLTGWDNLIKRPIKTYSGGMRRRLDLAASLIVKPKVLFLDEPTTGLDPRGRQEMWEVINELVKGGVTLLLTTQYLEEADQLADEIVVIDRGHVIAKGTSDSLKKDVGGERLEISVPIEQLGEVRRIVERITHSSASEDVGVHKISVAAPGGTATLIETLRELDTAGIHPLDIALKRPSLDDVFLALTGHIAEEVETSSAAKTKRGKR
jgi:ABC-2 type transport system ATP-binding protein